MKRITVTVLVAEDHTVVRQGLRRMLELLGDLEVVGEARHGREAVALAKVLRPDVVLMDMGMPLLDGLGATRRLLEALPATKVLILSAYSEDAFIESAAEAGAVGYLLKQDSLHEIYRAIRQVKEGRTFFVSSKLSPVKLPSLSSRRTEQKLVQLTSREVDVLRLIAAGKANKETAFELQIALKTVEKHREHLMKKLDLHNAAGLTRYALSAGIV